MIEKYAEILIGAAILVGYLLGYFGRKLDDKHRR